MIYVEENPEQNRTSVRYTTFWPEDYSARVSDGTFEILDGQGNIVVRDGESVTITGKVIPTYVKEIQDDLPGGFFIPYLIVDKVVSEKAPDSNSGVTSSGSTFTPENGLASIPVYPGSEVSDYLDTENVSRATPVACLSVYKDPDEAEYQTESYQYMVSTNSDMVIAWYQDILGIRGYRKYLASIGSKDNVSGQAVAFYLPARPYISVEVHTYRIDGVGPLIYELVFVKDGLLARPYNQNLLPGDIESVTIHYTRYGSKTITDAQPVQELVSIVNSLPVRPGYVFLGYPGGPETVFSLELKSASQGVITVTSILNSPQNGINIEGHPVLFDTHNLLRDLAKQLVQ